MAETFKSNHVALTTSNQDIVAAIAASTTAIVLSIRATNVDGTNAFNATVVFYNHDDTSNYHIAKLVTVPAGTTLVVLGKDSPIYLEESDKITAYASAASDGQIVISYEEMDDA